MRASVAELVSQKGLPQAVPALNDAIRGNVSLNPVDWLDDGSGNPDDANQPVPQAIPYAGNFTQTEVPVLDGDYCSDDEEEPDGNPALASPSGIEVGKDLEWLRRK